ncbi:MAG: LysR substrate-binding domain-containing protein [Paracoccaceae bacterium]
MQKLPPLRSLQAFEAFGRLGSATAAAAEMGVTIGAISQQLRKAEEALGMRLIERRGKSIALTAAGRAYHSDILAGFDLLRAAQACVARRQTRAVLTISCLPSLAAKWIGAQLFDWQSAHPGATVRLIGDDSEPVLDGTGVDFRLSYGDLITRFDNRTRLFTDWVLPACAPALASRLRLEQPADVLRAPLLAIEWAQEQGAAPGWADWAAHIGAPPPASGGDLAFSMSSAAIDAAINGRGFVLAQWSMAAEDIAAGRLVVPFDLPLPLPHPYALAWSAAALEKPFGSELRAWIQRLARAQKPATAPPAV